MPLLNPENLPEVMASAALIISAIGGVTWWRARNEPPKPGSPDAFAVAIVELTKAVQEMVAALRGQNDHFSDNNDMFKALGPLIGGMAKDFNETRRETAESRILLALIRDALNRRR